MEATCRGCPYLLGGSMRMHAHVNSGPTLPRMTAPRSLEVASTCLGRTLR